MREHLAVRGVGPEDPADPELGVLDEGALVGGQGEYGAVELKERVPLGVGSIAGAPSRDQPLDYGATARSRTNSGT